MNLIVLHGPPASGKLSIALQLEALIGSKTFHNHLTIDVVKPFFDFNSVEFIQLVDDIRYKCLETLLASYTGIVVFTWCYSHPNDLAFYEKLEKAAKASGSRITPVYLQCSLDELENRVVSDARGKLGKLNTVEGLQDCLQRWNLVAIPREHCITLNTVGKTPKESAVELVENLKQQKLIEQA